MLHSASVSIHDVKCVKPHDKTHSTDVSVHGSLFFYAFSFSAAIVYETLYKKVYKLPDIEYSVETMLHSDINHEPRKREYKNGDQYATHIVFEDGRKFELDRPGNEWH